MCLGNQRQDKRTRLRVALPIGLMRMKAIFFLLFAMVTLSLGASAFELSTRAAEACPIQVMCD